MDELAAAVRGAAERGLRVKAVGTGHSFSAIAATDGLLIGPHRLTAVREVDREAGTVTVESGLPLKELNRRLAAEGLALANMGDIAEQTVAGAVSTGTHGTGRDSASLSAQMSELEMVLADGTVTRASAQANPELFAAARVGLGALGVISAVTFAVEPAFLLHAREEPMRLDRVLAEFGDLARENEHFEFYWFPHTRGCLVKRNNRSPGPAAPLSRARALVDDELLSNGAFQLLCSIGRAAPAVIPAAARISSRALSARSYTDASHRVFCSRRRVRFVEMEYALPVESAVDALRELRALVDRSRFRVGFPVEVRVAPADDIWLSTASGRRTAYIAVHLYRGTPHQEYFTAVERIMTAREGRPHWGKLHSRDAGYLAGVYPRLGDFTALRDRVDPHRLFGNDHLRRVLGE